MTRRRLGRRRPTRSTRCREGARVGTASLRRRSQLLAARPDLEVVEPMRGNVDTRLRKLARGRARRHRPRRRRPAPARPRRARSPFALEPERADPGRRSGRARARGPRRRRGAPSRPRPRSPTERLADRADRRARGGPRPRGRLRHAGRRQRPRRGERPRARAATPASPTAASWVRERVDGRRRASRSRSPRRSSSGCSRPAARRDPRRAAETAG